MIFKWLLIGGVIWFFYSRFKRNAYIEQRKKEDFDLNNQSQQKSGATAADEEYIDYEEVD